MSTWRYCGRTFTEAEMAQIRGIIADGGSHPTRAAIARALCEALSWRQINGRLKDMSARQALLRMHRDGLICLPPPAHDHPNRPKPPAFTAASDPGEPVIGSRHDLTGLRLHPVADRAEGRLWNELIERYHYLGFAPLTGARLRYLIRDDRQLLGALGFGAAAWRLAPRDRFIDWTDPQRLARLHLVVNNARFLLLPWVRVKNLASAVLALAARQLQHDWLIRYHYQPVLLETFVDPRRYAGTCYKAANWIALGHTQGRGKLDRYGQRALPVKAIFVYPLHPDFRAILTGCAPAADAGKPTRSGKEHGG
jgi:hypothetical protein